MHQVIEQGAGKPFMSDTVETGRMCAIGTDADGDQSGKTKNDPKSTVQNGHRGFQSLL